MDYTFNAMVERVREAQNDGAYSRWPGRMTGEAVTLYPNLWAFLDCHDGHFKVADLAGRAKVTVRIMTGAMEDGEKLTEDELYRLAESFDYARDFFARSEMSMTTPEDPEDEEDPYYSYNWLVWKWERAQKWLKEIRVSNAYNLSLQSHIVTTVNAVREKLPVPITHWDEALRCIVHDETTYRTKMSKRNPLEGFRTTAIK